MSKWTSWTEFSEKERKVIYKRDDYRCIISKSQFQCETAHVFIPRSAGGVGNRLNGVILNKDYHKILDNKAHPDHQAVKDFCENYLREEYGEIDLKLLKYNKWRNFSIN